MDRELSSRRFETDRAKVPERIALVRKSMKERLELYANDNDEEREKINGALKALTVGHKALVTRPQVKASPSSAQKRVVHSIRFREDVLDAQSHADSGIRVRWRTVHLCNNAD